MFNIYLVYVNAKLACINVHYTNTFNWTKRKFQNMLLKIINFSLICFAPGQSTAACHWLFFCNSISCIAIRLYGQRHIKTKTLCSGKAVRVPMLIIFYYQKAPTLDTKHQNWTMGEWKKVAWCDESLFFIYNEMVN